MKSEETIYDNKVNNEEGTQLDNQNQETQEQPQNVVAEEASKTGKRSIWRRVATGMGTGILLGGVSSFLMGSTVVIPDEDGGDGNNTNGNATNGNTGGNTEDAEVIIGLEDGDVDMATSVNDDMSFSEAFAAARAEVGGGGAFVWNGNVYSTYTAEEWDAMTDEQKEEYYENLNWSKQEVDDQPEVEVVSTTPDNPVDSPLAEVEVVVDDEPEVEVLGVVHDDETGANFGIMNVDDQEIVFVDVNDDGTFDIMASDLNQDGQVTDDEMAYIEEQQLTVEMFEDAAMDNDAYLASNDDEPDYINDAMV